MALARRKRYRRNTSTASALASSEAGDRPGSETMESQPVAARSDDLAALSHRQVAESIPRALLRYTLHADGRIGLRQLNSRGRALWELEAWQIERDPELLWSLVDAGLYERLQASLLRSAERLTPWHAEWPITTP